ncbi:MAG: glutathione S-transferase N-terminal domain-containing protein [Pseudomonadota bacterium]
MIDLYYWPTPNGWKITIMLEECGLEYRVVPVNIGKGDQFSPEFLKISPNNRMPAIVDHARDGEPVSVFESGAILWYLGEKTGQFLPSDPIARKAVQEWLFWQVGNLGPMAGQISHFVNYAPAAGNDYARERYLNEYNRCLGVLDSWLGDKVFIVNDYSIADMASWPWVLIYRKFIGTLDEFPNLNAWHQRMKQRPAASRAIKIQDELRRGGAPSEAERKNLFGQTAASVAAAVNEQR